MNSDKPLDTQELPPLTGKLDYAHRARCVELEDTDSDNPMEDVCQIAAEREAQLTAALSRLSQLEKENSERLAQMIAHRVCCGTEHDPANGKIHGYCVVCGVPWPCEYVGQLPSPPKEGL